MPNHPTPLTELARVSPAEAYAIARDALRVHGSARAAARALRVSRRTLRRVIDAVTAPQLSHR